MSSLDPLIHPLPRLQLCAALAAENARPGRNEIRFSRLKELLDVSDSSLSKNLSALEKAGYVSRHREYGRTRAKDVVWIALTSQGYEAYVGHMEALRELAKMS